jgi:hypothetical protein
MELSELKTGRRLKMDTSLHSFCVFSADFFSALFYKLVVVVYSIIVKKGGLDIK